MEGTPGAPAPDPRELGPIVGPGGVLFDPFTLVSHATDATDWRLHLPVAVVLPAPRSQVAPLLAAIGRLGLSAIPRGGGTGLTGGAVPLRPGCVVVNTERLDRIRGICGARLQAAGGRTVQALVLEVEAGVVTERAMEHAAARGLVFATDPTSAWASTIGGNIAENAGGKGCVQWGTCIDNLVSWRMALPGGRRITVRRLDHPLREDPPGRRGRVLGRGRGGARRSAPSGWPGDEIRRPGLWKDITNKALGGLPGMQKEGTDGVVTSAEFVLHREYPARRTLCLEFFGPDFDEASQVILALSRAFPFPDDGREALTALEHFDDAYVRAIGYQVKAARPETPRAGAAGRPLRPRPGPGGARGRDAARPAPQHPNTALFEARDAGRGPALLGRPQAARRHRPAHQRLQGERGRGAAARGAGRLRALRRRHQRGRGAVRPAPVRGAGRGAPAGGAAGRGRLAGRAAPGRAWSAAPEGRRSSGGPAPASCGAWPS